MKIYCGVLCRVVGGTDGLNVGKIVRVASYQGDHSRHGRIWRCTTESGPLVTEYGAIGIAADFAQDWLALLEPDETLQWLEVPRKVAA